MQVQNYTRLEDKRKSLAERIRNKLNDIISSPNYQKALQEPIVTVRQERYVVPVNRSLEAVFKV
jgi:DNA mismatch repair protein MutS2